MPRAALSRAELTKLLESLAHRLHEHGVRGRLLLVGGAAMSLGHGGRRLTRDVDAEYEPKDVVAQIAHEMALEQGLRDDWLNASAVAFIPPITAEDRAVLADWPGLTIEIVSARVLLAMKMAAFRAVDRSDLVVLFEELHITDPQQAVHITRDLYGPHSVVLPDTRDDDLYMQAEDILDRLAGKPNPLLGRGPAAGHHEM
jgi:hypothetical protein